MNEKDYTVLQALTSRRQVILDNIRDNDEAGAGYKKVYIGEGFLFYHLEANLHGYLFPCRILN